jgi:hypothetical protein
VNKYLSKIFWIIFIAALVEFQPISVSGMSETTPYRDYNDSLALINPNGSIAIVGDMQRTSLWELMMGREQNDYERERIISEVNHESPSMLI